MGLNLNYNQRVETARQAGERQATVGNLGDAKQSLSSALQLCRSLYPATSTIGIVHDWLICRGIATVNARIIARTVGPSDYLDDNQVLRFNESLALLGRIRKGWVKSPTKKPVTKEYTWVLSWA